MRIGETLVEVFRLLGEGLARLETLLLTGLLLGLMGLGLTQIVMRNLAATALPWADGMMRSMVLWLAMIAGVMAAGQMRHIRIDVIERWLSDSKVALMRRLTNLMTAVVCVAMTWFGLEMVSLEYDYQAVAFLSVPVWAVQLIVPIGFGLMAARFAAAAFSPTPPAPTSELPIAESFEIGDSRS